jgi:hypothetical protein
MIEIVVKKKKGIQYFTQETEDAIVRYNKSTDPIEREKIYQQQEKTREKAFLHARGSLIRPPHSTHSTP